MDERTLRFMELKHKSIAKVLQEVELFPEAGIIGTHEETFCRNDGDDH